MERPKKKKKKTNHELNVAVVVVFKVDFPLTSSSTLRLCFSKDKHGRFSYFGAVSRRLPPWVQSFCILVQKREKREKIKYKNQQPQQRRRRHVCSTSGNRQLYLSQLSYKLGKIVTLTLYDRFSFSKRIQYCMHEKNSST